MRDSGNLDNYDFRIFFIKIENDSNCLLSNKKKNKIVKKLWSPFNYLTLNSLSEESFETMWHARVERRSCFQNKQYQC